MFLTNFLAYLEINPEIQLSIIDADSTVEGVWSKSSVYAGPTCDVPVPTFEFSDLHMDEEFNIPKWSDLPGATMHEYLERYAKKFDILRRCTFNTEVISIEKDGKGWKLFTKVSGSRTTDGREVVTCDKLIMATGLCSKPYVPVIDTSSFEGLVIHWKDLYKCHDDLVSEKVKSVVVVGSHKSSVEAGAICAKARKTVHWLVRENGVGPALFLNAKLPNGRSDLELSLCRIMDFGTPTIFGYRGWWDTFFLSGKSVLGTKLFNRLQDNVTAGSIGDQYEKSENMRRLKLDICKWV
jgi:dimethylaniline monooxygenase (N-oxide forming)